MLSRAGLIFALACIVPYFVAIPIRRHSSVALTNNTVTPPAQYYLKTSVKGTGNQDKEGLYVSGYHTGLSSHLLPMLLHHSTKGQREVLTLHQVPVPTM